tara:strand:+ start:964 stop:1164 length:201 start_codon:yes stop_codon:yes gene_type:complete
MAIQEKNKKYGLTNLTLLKFQKERIMGYEEFKLNLELNYVNTYKQQKKVNRLYKQYLNEKKIQGKI